jgi:uncharacterized membrane protein YidH (DUF202 family)
MGDGGPIGGAHENVLMDVGAQAERTALAWQRTGFSAILVGALLVRHHVNHGVPPWSGLLLMVAAGLSVVVWVPMRYQRVLTTLRLEHSPVSRAMVPATAAVLALVIIATAADFAAELITH